MGGDRIELRGLRVLGTHGVLPEEQWRPQPFEVDLVLGLDLAPAAATDDLVDTVDYGALVDLVTRLVGSGHFSLLEALAGAIADAVLSDARVEQAEVAVRKLRAPVPADIGSVGVRLVRRRPGG
ncbi:MAG TPA: dihydroneopterin aldolase [Acidimicrobiales bacterium]|nr:dihydroneopterin aldolase [Acidimicrobiales bacterium]